MCLETDRIDAVSSVVADDWDTALYVEYLYLASRPSKSLIKAEGGSRLGEARGAVIHG